MTRLKFHIGTKIILCLIIIMFLYLVMALIGFRALDALSVIIQEVNLGHVTAPAALLQSEQIINANTQKTTVFILLAIVAGCVLGYVLIKGILQPVKQLQAGAGAMDAGDLKHRIPSLHTGDGLDHLGHHLNKVAEQLETTTTSLARMEKVAEELRATKTRYERAINGTNDGLFDWDLQQNKIYFSPRCKTMLGHAEGDFTDDPESFFRHVHPEDLEPLRKGITAHIEQPGQYFISEHRRQHKDGSYRWVQCRALTFADSGVGRATCLAGSLSDIHMRKLAEQQLVFETLHDMLTRLPNRNLLLDRLQHALELNRRHHNGTCGLLFLDLDEFKLVNDTLGHPVGDQMLVACCKRLNNTLRTTDTLARFGGDEFAILLENIRGHEEVVMIAQRIQQDLKQPFRIGNGDLFMGASIGITVGSPDYSRAEDMLRDADIAMNRAKQAGKGHHVIFDPFMREDVARRLKLETQIRQAVERNEFVVFYQPIINLQTSRLSGYEALLRWNHPELGMVLPKDFIPFLEHSGLIVSVGEWLLTNACAAVKSWHCDDSRPSVSVNISAVQLRKRGLVPAVCQALTISGLPAQYLTLEVTESNIMQNEELAHDMLNELKQLGIKLAVDDFGTGFSSLSYLKRFPWDYIKIDRSFVRDIALDQEDAAIINAIITMAHSLKIQVIAEGVENAEQLNFLTGRAVNSAQGYYLARPEAREKNGDVGK